MQDGELLGNGLNWVWAETVLTSRRFPEREEGSEARGMLCFLAHFLNREWRVARERLEYDSPIDRPGIQLVSILIDSFFVRGCPVTRPVLS